MHFIWYVLIGLVLAIAIALHKKKKSQKPQLALNRFSHPNVADFGPKTGATYLVTGGNGFLGSHVVEALLARGETKVIIFDVAASPLFDKEIKEGSVRFIKGDLCDAKQVGDALRGVDVVFHIAACVNYYGSLPHEASLIRRINVDGTDNVLKAAVANGVQKFILTSSTSVCVDKNMTVQKNRLVDIDETVPCAKNPASAYAVTKIECEKLVLAVNGTATGSGKGEDEKKKDDKSGDGKIYTAALRLGGIFGPRDNFVTAQWEGLSPAIGERGSAMSYTFAVNAAVGFLCCERNMGAGTSGSANGEVFYIVDDENLTYGELVDSYFALNKMPPSPWVPRPVVVALAHTSEFVARYLPLLKPLLGDLNQLRPPVLVYTGCFCTNSVAKAKKLLGFRNVYSWKEAAQVSHAYWQKVFADNKKKQA